MSDSKRKPFRTRLAQYLKGETTPGIDPDVVREMAKLLEETGLSEIEVERGGVRVRVARETAQAAAPAPQALAAALPAQDVSAEPAPKQGTVVTSPMVGTVYLSPQPGAPPFVTVGTDVTDGTVCIIEAMKTMNPVAAPVPGRVVEIFVRDGQPVEFGEPLMRID
jgi:acetyl-CoA carboxylase biotin carboxyl carrier protein